MLRKYKYCCVDIHLPSKRNFYLAKKKNLSVEIGGRVQACKARLIPEPRREKTGLRGFRPGPTQTGLYKLRKELETGNFGFRK